MKKIIYFCFSTILLFSFFSCNSTKINTSEIGIIGKWYPDRMGLDERIFFGEKTGILEKKEPSFEITKGTPQQVIDKMEKWFPRDTVQIIERIKSKEKIMIVLKYKRKEVFLYNVFRIENTQKTDIKTIDLLDKRGYESVEKAKEAIENFKSITIKHQILLSANFVENSSSLKPLYEISKEDYIKVTKKVRNMEKDIDTFIEEQGSNNRESKEKIASNLIRKELFMMGYNPYLDIDEEGNIFLKKFEGDKDIEELNNVETEIKF